MRVGLIVTLAPAPAARLAAQGLDSMPALGVRPGNVVRVTLKEAGSVEGPVRAVSPDALLIAIGGRDSSVAVARIDSLWVRRSHAATGGVVGGAVGLVVGVVAAGVVMEGPAPGPGESPSLTVIGGVMIGAFIGAAVGSGNAVWELLYP